MLLHPTMNKLNELIEHLYHEGIEEGQLLQRDDPAASASAPASGLQPDVERLRIMLGQMAHWRQSNEMPEAEAVSDTTLSPAQSTQLMLQWEALRSDVEALRNHIRSLESDIVKMQPWGDFDVLKVSQLKDHGCCIRFWVIKANVLARHVEQAWYTRCNVLPVNQDADWDYFVTVTPSGDTMDDLPPEAIEQDLCPCPVSTLIMLQTRDKDSLKQKEAMQQEFVHTHYAALYHTLRQLLPPGTPMPKFKRTSTLRQKLRGIFGRN